MPNSPSKPMEDDACKVLIEPNEAADADCNDDDDDDDGGYTDESHVIFVLNMILSGTARLNVLLPTATILAFTIFAPLLTDDGKCDVLNRWLMAAFVGICGASCVFFTFTDSFRTKSGRLRYGIATVGGIWTFSGHSRKEAPPPEAAERCRLSWADLFHALLSLVAFLTFAGSHHDVVRCYYPAMPRKLTNTVPLVVGFLVSVFFVVFPSKRRGIGYPFLLLHTDRAALNYSRR